MTGQHPYTIVVGVDGSPSSRAALRWAVWQAKQVGGSITAVMAWNSPLVFDWRVHFLEDLASASSSTLHQVVDEVVDDPTVHVHKEVVQSHPARALLDTVRDLNANLLVLGNRGYSGFAEALLGSVSQHCVHHARCPTVIVRESDS